VARPEAQPEPQPEAAAPKPRAVAQQKIVAQPVAAEATGDGANPNGAAIAQAGSNGHTIADEIQIDLEELQAAIDRSQLAEAAPPPAKPAPQAQVPPAPEPPVVRAAEPPAAPEIRAPSLEPDLASLKAAPKAARPKSMEDEMQRLLDELSGPIRN
jgi:hypothetical protein